MYSASQYLPMTADGFSHSGISGSTPACGFPELIAANHALHRLLAPRHPPRALSSLTIKACHARLASGRRLVGLQGRGQGSKQETRTCASIPRRDVTRFATSNGQLSCVRAVRRLQDTLSRRAFYSIIKVR